MHNIKRTRPEVGSKEIAQGNALRLLFHPHLCRSEGAKELDDRGIEIFCPLQGRIDYGLSIPRAMPQAIVWLPFQGAAVVRCKCAKQ